MAKKAKKEDHEELLKEMAKLSTIKGGEGKNTRTRGESKCH
jgi:hypothetical protein